MLQPDSNNFQNGTSKQHSKGILNNITHNSKETGIIVGTADLNKTSNEKSRCLKLLLVSNRCKYAAILEKSTNPNVIAILYNYENVTYDYLLALIWASLKYEQKVTAVCFMITCKSSGVLMIHSGHKTGSVSHLSTFSAYNGVGKFVRTLYEYFMDKKWPGCRLDIVAPTCQNEIVGKMLQDIVQIPVYISKELFGCDTVFNDGHADGSTKIMTVAEVYFKQEKLRNWTNGTYLTIDLFEKIRMVGKGAFGTAVLYRKKDDNSLVVLKEINMTELNSHERLMSMNETRVLAMLNHPNIISYYDAFEENGVLMIEMEYADDGTLAQFLAKQDSQLDEKTIVLMFSQIVSGISYMHEQKVLHRDLKTANIFMTKSGILKVGDFGVAKVMSSQIKAKTVIGTPHYISPEICEGKPYDEKSDIWALGCILYEMASRQRTFEGSNLPALVHKIMSGQIARIRGDYSSDFRRLVKDMLMKEPSKRPTANSLESKTLPPLLAKYGVIDKHHIQSVLRSGERKSFDGTRSVLYLYNTSKLHLSPIEGFPSKIKIRQVAVGRQHVVVVAMERTVYTWGDNTFGQLGHGHHVSMSKPHTVEALVGKSIVSASCGADFSVFVSDNGIALTCGDGSNGCLGHGDHANMVRPRLVEALLSVDVATVACGTNHVVVLGSEGEIYAWGCGNNGQLGTGLDDSYSEPKRVQISQSIRDVKCGHDATIFITEIGTLFACGNNSNNKLGLNERTGFLKLLNNSRVKKTEVELKKHPTAIKSIKSVIDVQMGRHHTAVLTEPNDVWILGSNKDGQMATGDNKPKTSPHLIKDLKDHEILMVACGDSYTVVGTSSSNVLYWGTRNTDYGNDTFGNENSKDLLQLPITQDFKLKHRRTPSSTSTLSVKSLASVQQDSASESFNGATSSFPEDIQLEEYNRLPEAFYFPFPILDIQNSKKSIEGDLAVFLDYILPYGSNIFILVETNAPLSKERQKKYKLYKQNSTYQENEMSSGSITNTSNDFEGDDFGYGGDDDATDFMKKMFSDVQPVQPEKLLIKTKPYLNKNQDINNFPSSSQVKSKTKRRHVGVERNKTRLASTNDKKRHENSLGMKSSAELKAAVEKMVAEKLENHEKLVRVESDHKEMLQKIEQNHEREKQELEQKLKHEILYLKQELNAVIKKQIEINHTANQKANTSRICNVQ